MDKKIDLSIPNTSTWKRKYKRQKRERSEEGFRCKFCHAYVYNNPVISGVQNRNHCPYCLRSLHLDQKIAGDRLSACKATMEPIGLTVKRTRNKYAYAHKAQHAGELMLIHQCSKCGRISINRIAADDIAEELIALLCASSSLDAATLHELEIANIHLLTREDTALVERQLFGSAQK